MDDSNLIRSTCSDVPHCRERALRSLAPTSPVRRSDVLEAGINTFSLQRAPFSPPLACLKE